MAAPTYDTDLVDVTDAETTTGWAAYGGGGAGLDNNADVAMQGSFCVAKQITNSDKGVYFTGSATGFVAGTDHIWVWLFCGTPGLTATKQNKGASVLVGSGSNAYCQYHIEGSDTYGASGRVAKCYPLDYAVRTSNTGSAPYRTVTGNPGATPTVFGGGLVTTASVKGFNVGVDAIRFGTGAYITAGDATTPATFSGFQATNDAIANRWGILTKVGGSFELQGAFVLGRDKDGVTAAAYFKDSDQSIAVVDTEHSTAGFTFLEVDHASTYCELINISITALGTTARGNFNVTAANPTVKLTGCTWTGLGTITLRGNSVADGTTLRLTDTITQNGAQIKNGLIDRSRAAYAIVSDNLANIDQNTFVSDGSNTAVNYIGAAGALSWNNKLTGYDAGTAPGTGVNVAITGGSITGNEAIYIPASSGLYEISVGTFGDIPSVATGGAQVYVSAGGSTFLATVSPTPSPNYEWRLYTVSAIGSLAGAVEIAGAENETSTTINYPHTYTNQPAALQIISNDYVEKISYFTLNANDIDTTINLEPDLND